jgi:hypothetical protein
MKAWPDQLSPWLGSRLHTLGTDGFGRSENREHLRHFFETSAEAIAQATLSTLAREGKLDPERGTIEFGDGRRGQPAVAAGPIAAQPGFSPMDKSNPAASKQDGNLKPHPTPPIAPSADKVPLDKIKLPSGFKAELWSSGHAGGRTMVMGDKGTMFMGTRVIGRVYAITDKGGKREPKVIIQGMTQPNGLAFKDGSLYVFAINKVYRYDKIEDNLDKLPEPVELTKAYDLPDTIHHNWKYVAFGPDGKMYVQVGANCNICEINPGIHGQIRRYNADGSLDVYFGPRAPADKESNWVPTKPGGEFEVMFRAYAPTKAFFDKTWRLPDIERVN